MFFFHLSYSHYDPGPCLQFKTAASYRATDKSTIKWTTHNKWCTIQAEGSGSAGNTRGTDTWERFENDVLAAACCEQALSTSRSSLVRMTLSGAMGPPHNSTTTLHLSQILLIFHSYSFFSSLSFLSSLFFCFLFESFPLVFFPSPCKSSILFTCGGVIKPDTHPLMPWCWSHLFIGLHIEPTYCALISFHISTPHPHPPTNTPLTVSIIHPLKLQCLLWAFGEWAGLLLFVRLLAVLRTECRCQD